ncbi:MAG: peptide deformylase, partial [Bacteroidota bacterium]
MLKYSIYLLLIGGLIASCTNARRLTSSPTQNSFSKAQQELILSAEGDTPMRVYKITNQEDSILLRTQSENVVADPNDPVLQTFVKRLYSTVRDSMSLGVGIAAPQVGILKNIIWVQRFDKVDFPFEVYLNPKILQYTKKKQDCMEGCLSIPDRRD